MDLQLVSIKFRTHHIIIIMQLHEIPVFNYNIIQVGFSPNLLDSIKIIIIQVGI